MSPPRLVLASGSPRRQQMLTELAIDFEIQPAQGEEVYPAESSPIDAAIALAAAKAREVAAGRAPEDLILAVDTIVVLDGSPLGKPQDRDHAIQMLTQLRGRTHDVISGWVLRSADGSRHMQGAGVTVVTFASISDSAIASYVDTGEPMDKAGAYGIQGIGGFLVKEIQGSYSNVVGMPLAEVLEALATTANIHPFTK